MAVTYCVLISDNVYWFFVLLGVALVALSFVITPGSRWADLLLNVGATLILTSILAFLYQRFGSQSLMRQIVEMRQSLITTKRSFELGIRNMWGQRRDIENFFWNDFTASAVSEVWLFGIAELGYAEDRAFHRIITDGTARGCRFRILLLDPYSSAAQKLDHVEGGVQQVQGSILRALKLFQAIQEEAAQKPGTVDIRVTARVPHVSIVRVDSELLVTQYLPPLLGSELFTIRTQKVQRGIFAQYEKYLETTWENAKIWPSE